MDPVAASSHKVSHVAVAKLRTASAGTVTNMRPRVYVLGSHERSGFSMRRYTELLQVTYARIGFNVRFLRPPHYLSSRFERREAVKIATYFENLILFPIIIAMRVRRPALVHVADHSDAPWLFALPRGSATVTCHDLLAVRAALGEIADWKTRLSGRIYQSLILAGLRRAGTLVAVSQTTAVDAQRLAPDVRVQLIRNPLADVFLDYAHTPPELCQPGRPYVLVVSSSGWRKQRERSVIAWQLLRTAGSDLDLYIVGPPLTAREAASFPDGLQDTLMRNILLFTSVTDQELLALYRGADCILQLSLYEGFGWPIIEANSQARIAICSDIPVFREASELNIFVNLDDANTDWSEIRRAALNAGRRIAVQNSTQQYHPTRFAEAIEALAYETTTA